MKACPPRPALVSTPRRVMDRQEVRPLVAAWREQLTVVIDCDKAETPAAIDSTSMWLSGLRNTDTTCNEASGERRQSRATSSCSLQLPVEVLTCVFEYCGRRMLAYDLQLVCRCFYAVARQREFWQSFVLRDLVQEALPVVSRFVVLTNLYADEKEHKGHFWLRMLGDGRWPHPPSTVDFSCSRLRPRLVDRACNHASIKILSFAMCDAGNGEDLIAAVDPTLAAAGAQLCELDMTMCRSFEERSLIDLAVHQQRHLSRVDLSLCEQLSPTGIGELLTALQKTLTCFACRQTRFSSASLAHLSDAALAPLRELNVAGCSQFGDDGLAELARVVGSASSNCSSSLTYLNLAGCRSVSDHGLAALASGATCAAATLSKVILDDCTRVSDAGVQVLLRAALDLRELSIDRTKCRGVFFLTATTTTHATPSGQSSVSRCHFSLSGCLHFVKELMSSLSLRNVVTSGDVLLTASTEKFLASHRIPLCTESTAAFAAIGRDKK